jgi:hypothetical protein
MASIIGLIDQFLQNLPVPIREFLDRLASFAGDRMHAVLGGTLKL